MGDAQFQSQGKAAFRPALQIVHNTVHLLSLHGLQNIRQGSCAHILAAPERGQHPEAGPAYEFRLHLRGYDCPALCRSKFLSGFRLRRIDAGKALRETCPHVAGFLRESLFERRCSLAGGFPLIIGNEPAACLREQNLSEIRTLNGFQHGGELGHPFLPGMEHDEIGMGGENKIPGFHILVPGTAGTLNKCENFRVPAAEILQDVSDE